MPGRIDLMVGANDGTVAAFQGAGMHWLVETPAGVLYMVFVDTGGSLAYKKSADGGYTWDSLVSIVTSPGGSPGWTLWYDRWSGIAAGLIHIAFYDVTSDDVRYVTIDTENSDTLSTLTVAFTGVSAVGSGGHIAMTRARGGNVYIKAVIDSGAEGGFFRLANADVPNGAWAARTIDEAVAASDYMILLPGFAADNQDIIGIFWDASANEISRKLHDDSGNSWGETSIAGSMTETGSNECWPNFDAAVDLANSRIVLVAWSVLQTVNADLRCWTITESAITEVTNVILNSGGEQGICAISIGVETGWWHVFFAGASDGSENFATSSLVSDLNVYERVSKDAGTTWSADCKLTNALRHVSEIYTNPRHYTKPIPVFNDENGASIAVGDSPYYVSLPIPGRFRHQILGG